MRNSFNSKQKGFTEDEKLRAAQALSLDQTAIVWISEKEVLALSPVQNKADNTYNLDIAKLPADFNITANLDTRRKNQGNVPPVSEKTLFLTVMPDYSERTRILALNGNVLALNDDELSAWLINAERDLYLGTDGHPVFETALEDTSCFINRLPNGQVSMTEVPRQNVERLQERFHSLTGGLSQNLVIETPLRCVARHFLTSLPIGEEILRVEKEREATAILLIEKSGFSYGLWSPEAGLFSEYAFPAPPEIQAMAARNKFGQNPNDTEEDRSQQKKNWEVYIRQAFDQLFFQLSPEKLEQLELSSYAQTVWITETELFKSVDLIATEYSSHSGLEFIHVETPFAEAVADGLILGSFSFGNERVIGADVLPPVNMARDILFLADKVEVENRNKELFLYQNKRSRAAFALWAMPVLMVACLLGIVVNLVRGHILSGIREVQADAKTAELKQGVDRRKSYEANLKWYQEFIKQVSSLRRQQPVGTNLLHELNSNYPLNIDSSFYISEMKLNVSGGVEIKGLASNKDAVTSFLRSLEFAGGSESGKKLFSNLTYEVQEGVDMSNSPTNGGAALPTMAGSTINGTKPAPGVIVWSIRGNYLPAVEFAPPDPNKKPPPNQPPGNPNANSNTANQPPPAAPNQAAANTAK